MKLKRLFLWLPLGIAVGAVIGFSSDKLLIGIGLGAVLGVLMVFLTEEGMKGR